ncbi:MAG: histidine kinase dimerization/phospho-acceptor domain-containing protein, partial [Candidatus Heimdallarchaeota archaeon]
MKINYQENKIRFLIVLILIIISCILIYYFEIILTTTLLIAHFFYFPSILACLWWKRKGLIVPCFLAAVLILIHNVQNQFFFSLDTLNDFFRGFLLILVGIVVAFLSEQISKREIELNEIIQDLKRSNEDLQQFAYVASHDLQEPLRAIISFSQLLEDKYQEKLTENGKEFLFFITDGAKKMNILIKDLLAYSRITTHAEPPKWYDTEEILKDALYNLSESIKESGAAITYDKMPILKVDKTQFMQLFQNFISNAIKFRRDIPPVIHIGVKEENNQWVFSIKDNGIGIDSKYFDRLYNIFYRLHTKEE